jgi:hypothetical protein
VPGHLLRCAAPRPERRRLLMGTKVWLPEDKCGDELSRLVGPCQLHPGHWSHHRAKGKHWWGYFSGAWGEPVPGEPCPPTPPELTRRLNRHLSVMYWLWVAFLTYTVVLVGLWAFG